MAATIVGAYFTTGIVFLVLFELATSRIRNTIARSAVEVQERMALTGVRIGYKTSVFTILVLLWVFYPVVMYGALTTIGRGKDG